MSPARVVSRPSAAAVAAIRDLLPEWRVRLRVWKALGEYDGRKVDSAWLERERRAIREAEAWLAEWEVR